MTSHAYEKLPQTKGAFRMHDLLLTYVFHPYLS